MRGTRVAALLAGALLLSLLAACRQAPLPEQDAEAPPVSQGEQSPISPSRSGPDAAQETGGQSDPPGEGSPQQPVSPAGKPVETPEPAETPEPEKPQENPVQPDQAGTDAQSGAPAPPAEEPAPPAQPPGDQPAPSDNHTLYILMYHSVVEGDGSGCNDWMTTTQRLREDLQWLKDHGYTTLLPSELAAGTPLPQRAVLITFDDGYADNYRLAYPLLQEFQAKAVISMIVRRTADGKSDFLTWDMCREMAASGLVEIGSHTYDLHAEQPRGIRRLEGENREAYEARVFPDVEESVRLIEENVGQKVRFFAYPHGQTEPWAGDFLREHFAVSVTTRHGPANISGGLYDLPRHNINARQPASKYLPD